MSRTLKRKANGDAPASLPFRKVRKSSQPEEPSREDSAASEATEFYGFASEESSEDAGVDAFDSHDAHTRNTADHSGYSKSAANGALQTAGVDSLTLVESQLQSNLIHLQIQSVLDNVQPDEARSGYLTEFLGDLEAVLKASRAHGPLSVNDAVSRLSKKGIGVPFCEPLPPKDAQWKVAYEPPMSVQYVGSWPLKSACVWKGENGWSVDIAVSMPKALMQANDHKDHRYFHKRAYYVACIAAAVKSSSLRQQTDVSFGTLNGDARKPTVELHSAMLTSLRCHARVFPVFDIRDCPLKLHRLDPSVGNARDEAEAHPTPSYNAAILLDGLVSQHHLFLSDVAARVPHFASACTLLKAWAHQRAFGYSNSCRSEVGLEGCRLLLTMILAHILTRKVQKSARPPDNADAWTLFRTCLEIFGREDYVKKAQDMSLEPYRMEATYNIESFAQSGRAVLVDPCGLVNLLEDVPQQALHYPEAHQSVQLVHCARTTTCELASNTSDGFEMAFVRPYHSPTVQFDNSASILLNKSWLQIHCTDRDAPNEANAATKVVSDVLTRALGNRILAMSISKHTPSGRDAGDYQATSAGITLTLGLVLDSNESNRLVDLGPPADDVQAVASFTAFWGDKSELRRFKDGRILESVVWSADTPLARSTVVGQIVRHVLCTSQHLKVPSSDVHIFVGAFDDFLSDPLAPLSLGFPAVQSAFDVLSKAVRTASGLPLTVATVSPVSEALRYTSVFVPHNALEHTSRLCQYIPVMDVHVMFESSSRWPGDFEAVQKLKAALLVKLAQSLRTLDVEQFALSRVELACDPEASAHVDNTVLEVLSSTGLGFRLRCHYQGEREHIERHVLTTRHTPKAQETVSMLAAHTSRFVSRPRHHAAVSALQHRHASFSSAVRITKRWLGSHMLSPHIPAECAELLVAHVYICIGARAAPASGATGFLRVLELLTQWDWRRAPLMIPLYSAVDEEADLHAIRGRTAFPADKHTEVQKTFEQTRKADPLIRHCAFVMATEHDTAGRDWTWHSPNRVVASRLVTIATASLKALEATFEKRDHDVRILFSTPLDVFDFIIHLDIGQLPRYSQTINLDINVPPSLSTRASAAPLGFDPAAIFLDHLYDYFSDTALLFHDINGGSIIGGVFDPSTSKSRAWRVHIGYPCKPAQDVSVEATAEDGLHEVQEERHVVLDRPAMMADVFRIGAGLVKRIELKRP